MTIYEATNALECVFNSVFYWRGDGHIRDTTYTESRYDLVIDRLYTVHREIDFLFEYYSDIDNFHCDYDCDFANHEMVWHQLGYISDRWKNLSGLLWLKLLIQATLDNNEKCWNDYLTSRNASGIV